MCVCACACACMCVSSVATQRMCVRMPMRATGKALPRLRRRFAKCKGRIGCQAIPLPRFPTTSHYVPLRPTTSHYVPLRPTTSHYVPLRPTTSHLVSHLSHVSSSNYAAIVVHAISSHSRRIASGPSRHGSMETPPSSSPNL